MKRAFFTGPNPSREKEERAGMSPARLFLVAVLVVCTAFLTIPFHLRLIVSSADTEEMLLSLPVEENEMIRIGFVHSVNLSPVEDRYEVRGSELVLRSTLFKTYGAGIPILDDGLGTAFGSTPEGFEITGIDLPRTQIPIQLQTVPDHTLYYRQTPIRLLELAGPGSLVHIGIRRISLFRMLSVRSIAPYL